MLCEDCQRVFETDDLRSCPVCGSSSLKKIQKISCPVCGVEMKPGYVSIPLKIDWRDKWVKSGSPNITVTDKSSEGGWLRRVAYYCSSCCSFFLFKAVKTCEKCKADTKKTFINLLCPGCGSDIIEEVNFCPFCGFKLKLEDDKKISRVKFSL